MQIYNIAPPKAGDRNLKTAIPLNAGLEVLKKLLEEKQLPPLPPMLHCETPLLPQVPTKRLDPVDFL